jgi:hypothetical protein
MNVEDLETFDDQEEDAWSVRIHVSSAGPFAYDNYRIFNCSGIQLTLF